MTKLSGQKTFPTKKKLARTGEEKSVFSACIIGFFFFSYLFFFVSNFFVSLLNCTQSRKKEMKPLDTSDREKNEGGWDTKNISHNTIPKQYSRWRCVWCGRAVTQR